MRHNLVIVSVAIVMLILGSACTAAPNGNSQGASSSGEVVVFAAASLSEPFTVMADVFSKQSGARPTYNFGGSNQLRGQIEQGARADVFASANQKEMDTLAGENLLAGPPRLFASNRLVVITPRSNPGRVGTLSDLSRAGVRLVLAGPDVPAGGYALEMLDRMSADPEYGHTFKEKVLGNVVSLETDVKQVVAKVQLGEADAGVAYASDVSAKVAEDVGIIQVPDQFNVVAQYPIGVLKDGRQPAVGESFVRFVLSPDGQAILKKYNLIPVK